MKTGEKRLIALLLALFLILGWLPGNALAAENGDITPIEPVQITFINPLYADVVEESDLNQSGIMLLEDDVTYYTTAEEIAPILRQGMLDRQETICVYFQTEDDSILESMFYEFLDHAFAHTGVPGEGDNLLWEFAGAGGTLTGYMQGSTYYLTYIFSFTYYTDANQESKVDEAVDALLEELELEDMTDFQKVQAIYDWMCANITYDHDGLSDNNDTLKFTTYGAIIDKNCVCQGYANLFYRLALECGIDSRIITGTSFGEGHAWNIVALDKVYYNLDATWDTGENKYSYFLRCDDNFANHERDSEYASTDFYTAYPMTTEDYPLGNTEVESCTHNYGTVVTPPDCATEGYTTYTCSVCGHSYVGDQVPAGGSHSFTDDTDTKCDLCGCVRNLDAEPITEVDLPFTDREWEVLKLTNRERLAQGLWPLTGFELLQSAADIRAEEIQELFSHTRPDGTKCSTVVTELGFRYTYGGENIAYGYPTPEAVMNGWMNSSGHRANILRDSVYHLGVGEENNHWVQFFLRGGNYSSIGVYVPEELDVELGTELDDLNLIAVLEETYYSPCYLPVDASYCYGYDPNVGGDQTVTITALGLTATFDIHIHEWTEATCAAPKTCIHCEATDGEALAHSYSSVITAPTCSAGGYTTYTCSACGHSYVGDETDALEHSYSSVITTPTCTEDGYTTYTCSTCSHSYVDDKTDATGHDYASVVTAPTCTEGGFTTYTCTVCKDTYVDDETDATGHDYTSVVTAPTCTEGGFTTYTCTVCKDTYVDDETDATGHALGDWYQSKAPSETENSENRRDCAACDYCETEVVSNNPFTDIPEGKYYHKSVLWAYYNNITKGLNATTFGVNSTCTREQVVTFLWSAAGRPEPETTENPFTDVVAGKYYYKAVLWAVENGITKGTTATTFGVGEGCTRAQVVTFIWSYFGRPEPETTENPFSDVETRYYYKAVLWAVENGITSGYKDGTFQPNSVCTREQIVTFLYRAYQD